MICARSDRTNTMRSCIVCSRCVACSRASCALFLHFVVCSRASRALGASGAPVAPCELVASFALVRRVVSLCHALSCVVCSRACRVRDIAVCTPLMLYFF